MCKSKMAINVSSPSRNPRASSKPSTPRQPRSEPPSPSPSSRRAPSARSPLASLPPSTSSDDPYPSTSTSIHYSTSTTLVGSSSITPRSSLTSLRSSLPETPSIYNISEIRAATNSFLAKNFSSSSAASWRATLRSKDVVIFQRKLRSASLHTSSHLKNVLSQICRSHHMSIIKLLGASISGEHIYLVYEHVSGANLALCLRNPRNPNFTVLATWMSRMQIATDIAHGLDYIHNNTGLSVSLVHKHIKSTSFIVTEPSFNAKICHFGTAQLCGEIDFMPPFRETDDGSATKSGAIEAIIEEGEKEAQRVNRRSDSRRMQFEGTRGYMSPEFQATGILTQKSDVYAFGVVILELLSGEEPLKYKYDKESGEFRRTAVIETAKEAVDGGEGKVRRWMDGRLRDSFPVDVAEKMIRLGLDCVHAEADQRPNMRRVAGKISKLYLESEKWSDRFKNRGDGSIATLDMSMVGPRE